MSIWWELLFGNKADDLPTHLDISEHFNTETAFCNFLNYLELEASRVIAYWILSEAE